MIRRLTDVLPLRPQRPFTRGAARAGVVLPVLATVAILLAGCSGSADTTTAGEHNSPPKATPSTTSEPPPPPPPAPDSQECRDLGYPDISLFSNDTKPTPCKRPHTAYTFAVEKLPKDVSVQGVDIGNKSIQDTAARQCRAEFVDYVGGEADTRALSRLTVTYFVPGQHAFNLGARWVRCDIIAMQSEKVLAPLPDDLGGFLNDDDALGQYGVCSKGEPGGPAFKLVMCTQEHDYRAIAALRLGKERETYPGHAVTKVDGHQRCEDLIADELGLAGGYTFGWTYPNNRDWQDGQRFGYCWNKTSG